MKKTGVRGVAVALWTVAAIGLLSSSFQLVQAQEAATQASPLTDTKNYLPKFTSSSGALANSELFDNGTEVGVGTASPQSKLHVSGSGSSTNQTEAAIEITNTASGGNDYWLRVGATGSSTPAGGFSIGSSDFYIMTITASGNFGLGIDVNNPTHPLEMGDGAYEDSGTWTNASDRNLKENFADADGVQLLRKLAAMPIGTWNYKTEGKSVQHLGPVAQDFYAAFGLGRDDKHIATVDEGGVALAAIQQLYRMVLNRDEQVAALAQASRDKDEVIRQQAARIDRLQQLEQRVQVLATKLERIENGEAKASLIMAAK